MAAVQPGPLRLAYLADPNSVHTQRWIGFFAARGHEVHLLIGTSDDVTASLNFASSVSCSRVFRSIF